MKVVIIGGIAAGMSAAAKFKRLSPNDDVVVYEKGDIVSFGACGLPYYVGGFFEDSNEMIARTPEEFRASGIKLFTNHEVMKVDFNVTTFSKLTFFIGGIIALAPLAIINLS